MISNLNGSGSVRVHRKKRFLPVRGSSSVRLSAQNNIGLNGVSVGANGCLVTATRQCYSLVETRASNSLRVITSASDYLRW